MKTITKEYLVHFLDLVDPAQYMEINNFLWRCLPTDEASPEEIAAFERGEAEFAAGEYVTAENLPWLRQEQQEAA